MKVSVNNVLQALLLPLLLPRKSWTFSQPTPSFPANSGSSTGSATTQTKDRLFDMPVSNNGARCRVILYKKGLEDKVKLVSPMEIGGLRSEEYLKLNPQAKMPALGLNEDVYSSIAESDTIARYLLSKYADQGPSFQIDCPKSNYLAR